MTTTSARCIGPVAAAHRRRAASTAFGLAEQQPAPGRPASARLPRAPFPPLFLRRHKHLGPPSARCL